MNINLSNEAQQLFIDLISDAGNWGGSPLFGGNVGGDQQSKGYLTKLKKAGLLTTCTDDGIWVYFTAAGIEYAQSLGLDTKGVAA
jgi:hypothetical protein